MKEKPHLTLYELNSIVKEAIESLPSDYWLVAEISEIKRTTAGHCYLELIQKDDNKQIARARANIWASTFRLLAPYFETTTGSELTAGIKILINVIPSFHELFGYSLVVRDIEPAYTLGDIEQQRLATIKRLEDEGIFELNKELCFPLFPQKIAIISSSTAAGYEDFMNQLTNNSNGFVFYTALFNSTVQGKEAVNSITYAFEQIYKVINNFDLVVILRGGGSKTDLACFDSYEIASHIAQFPIPIITGIGHERDTSICDLVANYKAKTPTAAAQFIIENLNNSYTEYLNSIEYIIDSINNYISETKYVLENYTSLITKLAQKYSSNAIMQIEEHKYSLQKAVSENISEKKNSFKEIYSNIKLPLLSIIQEKKMNLDFNYNKVCDKTFSMLTYQKNKVNYINQSINIISPNNILKKGFSITRYKGKTIKDSNLLNVNDIIETTFENGAILSKYYKLKE